ncbi:branched-chain amino acid ABC transporter permease [Methylopila musalis]|uniref:Branched-chain amino acid ABC transporter permease n=1 Tax=Methylopila musalis TaxID=1134781 RepID=A0ABW3Z412_9HYPH
MSAPDDRLAQAKAEPLHPPVPGWAKALLVLGAVAVFAAPLATQNSHQLHVLITIFLYAAMAQSWNIMAGFSGQISLGHAAFFGLGAYATGVLYAHYGVTPWVGAVVGVALSVLAAAFIGVATLRLKGHHFTLATLLVGFSLQIVFARWEWVGAASGLLLPLDRANPWWSLQFFGSKTPYYGMAATLAAGATLVAWALGRSRLGYRLQAIRHEPDAAASLGVRVARDKVVAFAISAALMSVSGSFLSVYLLSLDPERFFSVELSAMVVLVTVLGGCGTVLGPIVGALILVPLQEYARGLFGGTGRAADLLIYGALILAICVWRPAGVLSLLGERLRRRERAA